MSGSGRQPEVAIVDNHMFMGDRHRGTLYMDLDRIPHRHDVRFGYDGSGELRQAQLARNQIYSGYNDQNQGNHYHNHNHGQGHYNDRVRSQNQRYHDYENQEDRQSRDYERTRSEQHRGEHGYERSREQQHRGLHAYEISREQQRQQQHQGLHTYERSREQQHQGQHAYERSREQQHWGYRGMNRARQGWDRARDQRKDDADRQESHTSQRYLSGRSAYLQKNRALKTFRRGRWQLSGAQRSENRNQRNRQNIRKRTQKLKKRVWLHSHIPVLIAKKVFYQTKRDINKTKNLKDETGRLQRGTDQAADKVEHANDTNRGTVGKINMISGVLARRRAEMGRERSVLGGVVDHSDSERRVKKVGKGGKREGSPESESEEVEGAKAEETNGKRTKGKETKAEETKAEETNDKGAKTKGVEGEGPAVRIGESRNAE